MMSKQTLPTHQQSTSSLASGPAADVLREQRQQQQQQQQQPSQQGEAQKPGFADQVKGYAKEFAGKTFNKEHEAAQGQAVRQGNMSADEAKQTITKESVNSNDPTTTTSSASALPNQTPHQISGNQGMSSGSNTYGNVTSGPKQT